MTTITDDAPIMNWVYIDALTCQLRYGIRRDAQPNFTGPFDCTRQDRRLTFQGWEGFCAVEMKPGLWGVFFDVEDDGLQGRMKVGALAPGSRILEIELARVEKKWKKDRVARTLDQSVNREKQLNPDGRETVSDPEVPGLNTIVKAGDEAHGNADRRDDDLSSIRNRPSSTFKEVSLGSAETQAKCVEGKRHSSIARSDSTTLASPNDIDQAAPAMQTTRSPTVIRVEPPVILSTYRSPMRIKARLPAVPVAESTLRIGQDVVAEPSTNEYVTRTTPSEPALLTRVATQRSVSSTGKSKASKMRSVLMRLGRKASR